MLLEPLGTARRPQVEGRRIGFSDIDQVSA
jgi:hypothetical protein